MFFIPHALLIAITDLGDSAVLSGIILITTIYLLVCGCRRYAVVLITAFLTTALAIGLLKMFFFSCHHRFALPVHIHSPSGHAALTTVVWGLLATLIAAQYSGWRRRLTLTVAIILIGSIAVTRWLLHFHTRSEIIAGLAVGLLGLLTARYFLHRRTAQKFDPRGLMVATVVAALVLHGFRLPAEGFMQALAQMLQGSLSFCAP